MLTHLQKLDLTLDIFIQLELQYLMPIISIVVINRDSRSNSSTHKTFSETADVKLPNKSFSFSDHGAVNIHM